MGGLFMGWQSLTTLQNDYWPFDCTEKYPLNCSLDASKLFAWPMTKVLLTLTAFNLWPHNYGSMSDCPLQVDHWIASRVTHVPGHTSQVWSYYIKETTGETQERREGSWENCTLGKTIQWASTAWTHPKWIPTTELMSTWDIANVFWVRFL